MEIMLPTWPQEAQVQQTTADIASVRGVKLAFVDDYLDSEFTDEVERVLTAAHGAHVKRFIKKLGNMPSPKPEMEEAAQCGAAVVGVAMCGSCTAATVFDAVALERMGLRTVTIVWDTFEKAARAAARIQGKPDIRFAVIPSRKGTDTAEEQRVKARVATQEIVRLLLAL
ncbi:hypothetical protein RA280_13695 [Cupriavidus sp. CV2]|uniref:UGSC family (seleno)protein n=1 Tax=Cupriavidus ulmosensis TaxID=3065913 RepID=UPI00296B0F50|nr:hypothetical protein [Cupriavidus sp. CV2]MDW3682778.1 hypothetical protein [Cupriavidus sp. CV2]